MWRALTYIILALRLAGIISFIWVMIAIVRRKHDFFYYNAFIATFGFFGLAFILWLIKFLVKNKD